MGGAPATVIIAVGDEVLSGHTQDTNSSFLAARAFAAGFPVRRIEVVADQVDDVVAAVRRALDEDDVTRIAVCGGIGPTPDDRTFAAVAAALDLPLEENSTALERIAVTVARLHAAGWLPDTSISEGNRRCALVPAGGTVLPNRLGMAPPMAYALAGERWLFILPGVPREFTAIVEEELVPRFFTGGVAAVVAEVSYRGVPEAELFDPLRRLAAEFSDVSAGSYPQSGARRVIVRLRGTDRERVTTASRRMLELEPRGELLSGDGEGARGAGDTQGRSPNAG